MDILLNHLIPHPVREIPHEDSDIWEAGSVLLEKGKTYLFTAPSGKGKTTLLSILYGIRKDYSGMIRVDGRDISTFDDLEWSQMRKHHFSTVFQGLELFDELTAMENIMIKNRQTDYYSAAVISELASVFDIVHHLERPAGFMSYGQKQRVAVIRALCQPFSFLFADEIFSHLDTALSETIFSVVISECQKRKAGLLFTALHEPSTFNFDVKYRI